MIRVLYVENGMQGGGSSESLFELVNALDRQLFEPYVVFTSDIPAQKKISQLGVSTTVFKNVCFSRPDKFFSKVLFKLCTGFSAYCGLHASRTVYGFEQLITRNLQSQLRNYLKQNKIDIIHTNNNVHRDHWAIKVAFESGVPCVAHLRSFHTMGFGRFKANQLNKMTSRFVGYSQTIIEHWTSKGLCPNKTSLVHNAISNIQEDSEDLRKTYSIQKDSPLIGIIGRIIEERGHEILFRALPQVLKTFPALKLFVVGDGDDREIEKLNQLIHELDIKEAVIMAGHQKNAKKIIKALDAIILPYSIEPFGRTLLEAWQLGTPVILSRVGFIEQIVEDGKTALLFEPYNVHSLSKRITTLLSDQALIQKLSEQGMLVCRERFSIKTQSQAIQKIYWQILKKQSPVH